MIIKNVSNYVSEMQTWKMLRKPARILHFKQPKLIWDSSDLSKRGAKASLVPWVRVLTITYPD